MANEITLTASLTVYKPSVMSSALSRAITKSFSMVGSILTYDTVSVGVTAQALGGPTSPHWCFFLNLDASNYILINNGSGGAGVIKLLAGDVAFVPVNDAAVLFATANLAPCLMEYLICSL